MTPVFRATLAAGPAGAGRGSAILKAAQVHGVPLPQDPLLAEALSRVETSDAIPETLFLAIAEVLGFLMSQGGESVGCRAAGYLLDQ